MKSEKRIDSSQLARERIMGGRYNSCFDHWIAQLLFIIIICSVPFFKWRDLPGPSFMRVDWLAMGGLLLVIGPCLVLNKRSIYRLGSSIWPAYLMFLLVNLISALISPFPGPSVSGMMMLVQGFVLVTMTVLVVNPVSLQGSLYWSIAWSTGIGALLACFGYFGGMEQFQQEDSNRGVGATLSSNNMAIMCIFAYPLVVYGAIYAKSNLGKIVGWIFTLFVVGGIVSTLSRAGFLVMMLTSVVLLNQYKNKFQVRYFGLVIAGVSVFSVAVVLFIPEDFVERQMSLVSDEPAQDRSLDRRSSYVTVAVRAFEEHPVIGTGPDTFKENWIRSVETRFFDMDRRPAHNTYLEVAVGTGTLGLFAFFYLLWRMYSNFASAEKNLREHGLEAESQLAAALKMSLVGVCLYFFFKSGLEHKYFLLLIGLAGTIKYYEEFKLEEHRMKLAGELPDDRKEGA
nr:O-antigen ligase family protein [Oceanobacter mangrovi]